MNSLLLAVAIHTLRWQDLSPPAQRLAAELRLTSESFSAEIDLIRERNARRLREGELDHLVFYLLQSRDFTTEDPIDPARAAGRDLDPGSRRRTADLVRALSSPTDERQRYFASLLPPNSQKFLEEQLARVLRWIHDREVGCRTAPSPQACIAALYVERGHSSDTNPQSIAPVRAAFEWLRRKGPFEPKRLLVIGPGSDFAPRTALRSGPPATYQPRLLRDLAVQPVTVDCVDLNARVVRAATGECSSAIELDIATARLESKYDAIIATNVLLYLNQKELLLAFQNIRAMLAPDGVFIHNDSRFETHLFGRAVGMPAVHFETVTLEPGRRPALVDRFVIHSRAAPKLQLPAAAVVEPGHVQLPKIWDAGTP